MAEYAGYVRRQPPINWGIVAGDIVNKMGDIEKEQAAFREKYDTMAADISKEIGEYEAGKSPAFNDLVYSATAEGREMIAEMHNKLKRREISPDEFNRMKMSISNQWADFSTLTKNYNEAVAGTMEGLQNGELSGVSQWALDQFGELANLKTKRLQWMPNDNGYTNLYVTSTDDEGNMVGEPTSVTTLTNPGNLAYLRVDVPEEVSKYADKLATYQIGRTSSPKERKGYEKYLNKSIDAIVSDDDDVASILSEYDGTEFYKSSEDAIEGGIEMTTDENGNWKTVITDEQRERAKEIVREQFEFQVPYTKTFREYTPPTDKGKYSQEDLLGMQSAYNISVEMANGDFSNADNDRYIFKPNDDGSVSILSRTKKVKGKDGKDRAQVLTTIKSKDINDAKSFAPYTGQFTNGKEIIEWDYINNQITNKPKITPGTGTSDFVLEGDNEFSKISEITNLDTDTPDNITKAQNEILKLIKSKIPTLSESITFGNIIEGNLLNEIPVLVNGEEVGKIKTDKYSSADKDTSEFKDNKKVIEAVINTATFTKGKEEAEEVVEKKEVDKENKNIGTTTYTDGSKYVGELKGGLMHGQGTTTYADGSKYVGEWKNGQKNGQGTTTFASGSKYVGEYKDGKYHGQGTYTFDNGQQEKVYYENGEWRDVDSPFAKKWRVKYEDSEEEVDYSTK
jgi:hypothetical protein